MSDYHTTQEDIDAKMEELDSIIHAGCRRPWTMRRVFKTISSFLFSCICMFMVVILVDIWMDRAQGITPSVFGYQIYRVETGSMMPTFPIGTVIISKEYDGERDMEVGEVVTFSLGDKIVTHRIVEVIETESGQVYRTKGDNPENDTDRELLSKDHIIAVYKWTIPFIVQTKQRPEFVYE